MNDADRYIWLLAHMGLVQEEAKRWAWGESKRKPLLIHLQDFIDSEMPKAGKGWIEKQRAILNRPASE